MRRDEVTVLMPTFNRLALAIAATKAVTHRPYLLVVDDNRPQDVPPILNGVTVVWNRPGRPGPNRAIETGILACNTRYIALIADDVEFPDGGDKWIEEAMRAYSAQLGERDGVIALNDGIRMDMACFPFFAKQFYLDHCYPVPYDRYYLDTDLSAKAQWLDAYGTAPMARATHTNIAHPDYAASFVEDRMFRQRMAEFRELHRK